MYKNNFKLILCIVLLCVFMLVPIFLLVDWRKEINREVQIVEATVIDVDYRSGYNTPYYNPATKTMQLQYHSADYDTFLDYEGIVYELDSSTAYNACKNYIGKRIKCQYVTIYYDDGSIKNYITIN